MSNPQENDQFDVDLAKPVEEHCKQNKAIAIDINSIAASLAGIEFGSVARELRKAWARRIVYYIENEGLTPQQATQKATNPQPDTTTEQECQHILSQPVNSVSWWAISILFERDPAMAADLWEEIKQEARNEFLSGHRAAGGLEVAEWQQEPWSRAQYLAIRDGFIEQWQPKGAIEIAIIDMMAQAFSQYLFWNETVQLRTTTNILPLTKRERGKAKNNGGWVAPRVTEQEAIEHAAIMMDRFNKLFLRTLRQLRDLRRYSVPLTINNPQQVNIATDNSQQMNLLTKE
jgi:hypothetical protein